MTSLGRIAERDAAPAGLMLQMEWSVLDHRFVSVSLADRVHCKNGDEEQKLYVYNSKIGTIGSDAFRWLGQSTASPAAPSLISTINRPLLFLLIWITDSAYCSRGRTFRGLCVLAPAIADKPCRKKAEPIETPFGGDSRGPAQEQGTQPIKYGYWRHLANTTVRSVTAVCGLLSNYFDH